MAGWAMAYPVWGTTCHQITSRVGGKMWTPWCVELKSHAYHFVFVSVLVFVFVFDLSSGTLRSRVVGVRYVHPGVQLESHAYHLSQPGGRLRPPAGLWNIICHLKSHKLIVITPGTLFIVSMIILIIVVVNVITWKGENVKRIWLLSGVVGSRYTCDLTSNSK